MMAAEGAAVAEDGKKAILEQVMKSGQKLVIIAEDVEAGATGAAGIRRWRHGGRP